MTQNVYLAPKPRYEILDGLRGVAALTIVVFHLLEMYGSAIPFISHGYLAVDFFFALSGFVIGYAYDDRWNKMSLSDFFKRRLIRLHPMLVMGTLLGFLTFYFGACDTFPLTIETPWWKLLLITLVSCLMIPLGRSFDLRGWGEVNTLNSPAWSLMWEYVVNILYALFIRHLPRTIIVLMTIIAAFFTLDLTLNLDITGLLAARSASAYTVVGGWSLTPTELYVGAIRLAFPFLSGLLMSKYRRFISVKSGFWWCSIVIFVLLAIPRFGGTDAAWMNGAYEAVCILFLFPIILAMGAGSHVTGKSLGICRFLGEISYPLYITHFTFIYLQAAWIGAHPDAPLGTHICMNVSLVILSIALAYACSKAYDIPVRDWLTKRFLKKG